MKIFMEITMDKYELPLKIANSATELAVMCGVSRSTVSASIAHSQAKGIRSRYVCVEVEDD